MSLRDNGWHVDVTEESVGRSIMILEELIGMGGITYEVRPDPRRGDRVFTTVEMGDIAAFDLWGNLVIYRNTHSREEEVLNV
jgi:hypothetical protein